MHTEPFLCQTKRWSYRNGRFFSFHSAMTRIRECLCKIKMNVPFKQTLADYSISMTSCTLSFIVPCCLIMLHHWFPWQWFSTQPSTPLTCAVFKCNLLSALAIICHLWAVKYPQIEHNLPRPVTAGHRGAAKQQQGNQQHLLHLHGLGRLATFSWKITTSNFFGDDGTLVLLPSLFFRSGPPEC